MIAKPHRLRWWAGWDYGVVQHAWRYNKFNPDYVSSACGLTGWRERLINNMGRRCKNCERATRREK